MIYVCICKKKQQQKNKKKQNNNNNNNNKTQQTNNMFNLAVCTLTSDARCVDLDGHQSGVCQLFATRFRFGHHLKILRFHGLFIKCFLVEMHNFDAIMVS